MRATLFVFLAAFAVAADANAEATVDRTAVRFVTAETGGNARPRFLSDREVAFFCRLEAAMENATLAPSEYPDRYVRSATDRLVARTMLASLMLQRGSEPPDLPMLGTEQRAELADRVGGAAALAAMMEQEKISEAELSAFLRDQVRANWYLDKAVVPILAVTDDALRETFRSATHPFKGGSFDEVKPRLKRWLTAERARVAELEFLQGTRARIKITVIER